MIDAAPDCLQQPMRDLIPQVQSLMRLRSFRIMTNRYVSAAAAVALGFPAVGRGHHLWRAQSRRPGVPAARPARHRAAAQLPYQRVNTAVGGFYEEPGRHL